MINDSLEAKGYVELVVTDSNGNVKEKKVSNTVVNTGKLFMVNRLLPITSDTVAYSIGVGSDETAVAVTQTGLIAALGARIASVTPVLAMTTIANDSVQFEVSIGVGATTLLIKEAGLFSALTGGVMLARTTFGLITKGPEDTLTITWKLQQA
jgi:hypothetical protein